MPVITTVPGSGFMHEVTKNVITSTYYALDSALNNTTNKSIGENQKFWVVLKLQSHWPSTNSITSTGLTDTSLPAFSVVTLHSTVASFTDNGPTPSGNRETQWLASTVAGISAAVCLFLVVLALFILCHFKWRILTGRRNIPYCYLWRIFWRWYAVWGPICFNGITLKKKNVSVCSNV